MTAYLWLALGAAVGAPARWFADRAVRQRYDGPWPWGTLLVNVVGSFVLGVVVGLGTAHDVPEAVVLAVGTGFCGALTTYSTFSWELLRLLETGLTRHAAGYLAASVGGGLAAACAGYLLGGL